MERSIFITARLRLSLSSQVRHKSCPCHLNLLFRKMVVRSKIVNEWPQNAGWHNIISIFLTIL